MSASTLTPLRLDQVAGYLASQHPANAVLATCAHHTWSPTSADWSGLSSMQGIRSYHKNHNGWSDIGANLYAGPDGFVWTARPLDCDNWAHAYVQASRPTADWSQVHPDARRLCNGSRSWLNRHAIGVEIVGNFDAQDPTTSASMALALELFALMHDHYSIPVEDLLFHRMVEDKTCPGSRVGLDWFRGQVAARLGQPIPGPEVVRVTLDGAELPVNPSMREDKLAVDLGPLLPALTGRDLHFWRDSPEAKSRCYLREVGEALGYEIDAADWPEVKLVRPTD